MLESTITAIVRVCTRFPWPDHCLSPAGGGGSAVYSARHFAITTDVNKLISPNLDWRQREADFEKAFPGHFQSILVVVDAPTAELGFRSPAPSSPSGWRSSRDLFRAVEDMSSNDFFVAQRPAVSADRDVSPT